MKVYHQIGHNHNWNIESFNDGVGDGLIYSPVNIKANKLLDLSSHLKSSSFLDPQLYLFSESKENLETYPYYIIQGFSTIDLESENVRLAKLCIDFQLQNDFEYLIIPTRYYSDNPNNYFLQISENFIEPFCDYINSINSSKKILLSLIVKPNMIRDIKKMDETLNWVTSHQNIHGVYIIFENTFPSKQIKEFDYLLNALKFIHIIKSTELEAHIGYTNTEALLYSLAMPDSISIGAYENLRAFSITRFKKKEKKNMRSPNARLYSSKLLQWVEYTYIQAIEKNFSNYADFFDASPFNPLEFTPVYEWHFSKPDPYKHYFYIFNNQVKSLPKLQTERFSFMQKAIENALELFGYIKDRVLLDDNSDGSHLTTWLNVINYYIKHPL